MSYMDEAIRQRPFIEKAAQFLSDADALKVKNFYPNWETLVKESKTVTKGFKFQYAGELYRTEQPEYTFVSYYVPGAAGNESLFSRVDDAHAGTLEDPIPYEKNMEIYKDLYYTQYGVTYLCNRDSGQPLQHDLTNLIGVYVEVVT